MANIFTDLEHDVSVLVDAPASVASLIVSRHSPDFQHATRHLNSIAGQGAAVGTDPLNPVKKGKNIIRFLFNVTRIWTVTSTSN